MNSRTERPAPLLSRQPSDSDHIVDVKRWMATRVLRKALRHVTLKRIRTHWTGQRSANKAIAKLRHFPVHADAPRHTLPGELIISLTSYPKRYATLHLTLKSLLDQQVRPDRIVLWIAHDQLGELPVAVTELAGDRLEIRGWDDIRSFKKIIPALVSFPGWFVLITDDDTYYPDTWLKDLVDAYDPELPTVVCHRAHRLAYTAEGRIAPYRSWRRAVSGPDTYEARTDLLPTGNGGVLYPPGSLAPQVTDLDLIRQLSPTSDDVWLYFMWRLAGWKIKRVPSPMGKFLEWPSSQAESLRVLHKTGIKDDHLRTMQDYYGVP